MKFVNCIIVTALCLAISSAKSKHGGKDTYGSHSKDRNHKKELPPVQQNMYGDIFKTPKVVINNGEAAPAENKIDIANLGNIMNSAGKLTGNINSWSSFDHRSAWSSYTNGENTYGSKARESQFNGDSQINGDSIYGIKVAGIGGSISDVKDLKNKLLDNIKTSNNQASSTWSSWSSHSNLNNEAYNSDSYGSNGQNKAIVSQPTDKTWSISAGLSANAQAYMNRATANFADAKTGTDAQLGDLQKTLLKNFHSDQWSGWHSWSSYDNGVTNRARDDKSLPELVNKNSTSVNSSQDSVKPVFEPKPGRPSATFPPLPPPPPPKPTPPSRPLFPASPALPRPPLTPGPINLPLPITPTDSTTKNVPSPLTQTDSTTKYVPSPLTQTYSTSKSPYQIAKQNTSQPPPSKPSGTVETSGNGIKYQMIKQHLRIKEAHNVSNEYPSVTVKPTRNPRDRCQSRTPPCCVPGILEIHLNKIKGLRPKQGSLEGVSVDIQKPKGRGRRQACSSTAVIVADFERLDAAMCTTGCLEGPYCGRRMLKLQLRLSDSKRCGMLLHVSDNKASDGERNKTVYSAEVQGRFPSMDIFPNDQCKTNNNSVQMPDSISGCVNDVTIYVSHHYIRVTSDVGMDYMLCHTCLSDLNKISNNTMYIALNRVLGDINQEGYGVCSAILTWECPWSNN